MIPFPCLVLLCYFLAHPRSLVCGSRRETHVILCLFNCLFKLLEVRQVGERLEARDVVERAAVAQAQRELLERDHPAQP